MGSGRGVPHLSGEADDSEDDRPEEVSMEAAKIDVRKRQSEEQAVRRSLASQAKAARRLQSQRKEEDSTPQLTGAKQDRKERSRKRKGRPEGGSSQAERAEPDLQDSMTEADDLLPAGLLAELAEKERLDNIERVAAAQNKVSRKPKREHATKASRSESESDRVKVVVLSSKEAAGESLQQAAAFRNDRLFGSYRRRSHSMLTSPHQLDPSFV